MTADLTLYGRPVKTVFDLLGDKENDLTYSVGWGLSQSPTLVDALLEDVFPGEDRGRLQAVRLQEYVKGSGFTDIEIETDRVAVVLEAKRGWSLPTHGQLEKYLPQLKKAEVGRVVVVSECTPDYAAPPRIPESIGGVPVIYRSWKQVVQLAARCSPSAHAEKRLLRELTTYLRGLMTMQNHTSNMVYVVSLGTTIQDWSAPFTPVEIVVEKDRYFHPVGNGYPKEPPNYIGFRWHGQLQQIRHVDDYVIATDPHQEIPEMASRE